MSKPESRRSTTTSGAVSENAFDAGGDQQATSSIHPSFTNQSGAEGGASTDAANQVAAQLAELLRSNPEALKEVLARAGQSTALAAGQVPQHPLSRFDKQKDNLVKGLGSLVEEVRQMNRNLRRSEQSGIVPLAAQYGDSGADRIEQLSNYLSGKNMSELVAETAKFAQRNAAYLVPGALLLGFLGARFLKSSNPLQTLTTGSQSDVTDVALPAPPTETTVATVNGAMHERTAQPTQEAGYVSPKQDTGEGNKSARLAS